MMKDGFGREIDYLRISVTDKCNLRCRYCMPKQGVEVLPHEEVLTLEEIFRVVRIMESLGVKKIRFTGGEPRVRKNLVKLIGDVNGLAGISDIAMTTNGLLLEGHIDALKQAGLKRVNISLDTLEPSVFEQITGYDGLARVLAAVDAALDRGMQVKINCVPCRELNDGGIEELAGLAREKAVDVRFIEYPRRRFWSGWSGKTVRRKKSFLQDKVRRRSIMRLTAFKAESGLSVRCRISSAGSATVCG